MIWAVFRFHDGKWLSEGVTTSAVGALEVQNLLRLAGVKSKCIKLEDVPKYFEGEFRQNYIKSMKEYIRMRLEQIPGVEMPQNNEQT